MRVKGHLQERWQEALRQERALEAELGGETFQVVTRPGFPQWEEVGQAARLLAEHAQVGREERVLVWPCGHGALGVWAARRSAPERVALRDTNIIAVEMARRTLAANDCAATNVEAALPAPADGPFDVVLLTLPKGRDLARLMFLAAFRSLRPGGRLYLAGANDQGIKSAIGDAEELFGPSQLLGYRGGNRVVVLTKALVPPDELPAPYRAPGLAEGTYATFEVALGEERYTLFSRPGVFAWRGLDPGTRLLLEVLPVRVTDEVLDVGCGYGIIGLHAARQATKGWTTLVDVDILATDCARRTLAHNGAQRAEVLLGDGLAAVPGRRFSLIVSNPPFHSGHETSGEIVEALVREAYAALEPRGRLVVVANRFLPYDRLMGAVFGAVETLAQTPQYHVLSADKVFRRKERGKPHRRPTEEDSWNF